MGEDKEIDTTQSSPSMNLSCKNSGAVCVTLFHIIRYDVSCYVAGNGGFRDNGSAHLRDYGRRC